MSVEQVSAEELAGLDLEDEGLQLDGTAAEVPVVDPAAQDDAADELGGLGFSEDAPAPTVDAYMEVAVESGVGDERRHYEQAAANAAEEGEELEEEEEEEEEEKVVDPIVNPDEEDEKVEKGEKDEKDENEEKDEAGSEEEEDGNMFFEDTAAAADKVVVTASSETAEIEVADTEPILQPDVQEVCKEVSLGPCANCGLPGHDTTTCPFGHPEDIQLGDMEESDSDDELPQAHPMLARYVSQHTGALVPKTKKGLTGEKRYFGDDKGHKQCWVCGAEDHESNDCKLKRCFFCGEPGHDSRGCTEKTKICSHCKCKGHHPVSCPTLAAQELVSFVNTHCLRCGALGHANCGNPPGLTPRPPTPQMQHMMSKATALRPTMLRPQPPPRGPFSMGLPPATPASPPPSPVGDPFLMVRPRPPRLGRPDLWMPQPGGDLSSMDLLQEGMFKAKSVQVLDAAPVSKTGKAPITKVAGKASISKVPGQVPFTQASGKAPIAKVPGKAAITKAPISKVPGKAAVTKTAPSASLMKASAKRPAKGGTPPPKKAKAGRW